MHAYLTKRDPILGEPWAPKSSQAAPSQAHDLLKLVSAIVLIHIRSFTVQLTETKSKSIPLDGIKLNDRAETSLIIKLATYEGSRLSAH